MAKEKDYTKQDKETFNEQYFKNAIELFLEKTKSNMDNRYKSWEYCYNFFHFVKNKIDSDEIKLEDELYTISNVIPLEALSKWTYKDQLALHLAFYMASWGMYRGSSFLLQNDYTIYKDVVEIIFEDKYNSLWNDKELFKNNVGLILDLYKDIQKVLYPFKEFYDTKSYFYNIADNACVKKDENNNKTLNSKFLTIITKIMLGAIGCFPALDRNFKYGFNISDNYKENFVENTINRVYNFALDNKNSLEDCSKKYNFPLMKKIDMYYFIKGQEDTFLRDVGFKKNEFKNINENDIVAKISQVSEKNKKDVAKFLYNNIQKSDSKNPREKFKLIIANPVLENFCRNNIKDIKKIVRFYKLSDDEEIEE